MDVARQRRVARGDLGKEGPVEIDEAHEQAVVLLPETHLLERVGAPLYLPARQALRIAGQRQAAGAVLAGAQESAGPARRKRRDRPRACAPGTASAGRRRSDSDCPDRPAVRRASSRWSKTMKWLCSMRMLGTPGEVSGQVASRLASPASTRCAVGIRIALQHVLDDDLVHPVPDILHRLGHLGAAHRAAERIEDAARGVVDDRGVELVAVAERLAVEQQSPPGSPAGRCYAPGR